LQTELFEKSGIKSSKKDQSGIKLNPGNLPVKRSNAAE
jgi:hypothetical protein